MAGIPFFGSSSKPDKTKARCARCGEPLALTRG